MIGRVVSAKTKNTVTVIVERVAMHPLYKKTFARSKKYLADADSSVKEGDIVNLIKIKPMSKNKHWKVSNILGTNLAEINEAKLKAEAEEIIAQVMPEEKEEASDSAIIEEAAGAKTGESETVKETVNKKQEKEKKKGVRRA